MYEKVYTNVKLAFGRGFQMGSFASWFSSPVETSVFFLFIFAMLSVYVGGGSYSDTVLVSGAGLILSVPFAILGGLASSTPLFAPFAALLLYAIMGLLGDVFGEALFGVIVVAGVMLMLGV